MKNAMTSNDNTLGYELSEIYPVPPGRVFSALTDATVLKRIWGVQEITVDARVGGKAIALYVIEGQDWSFTLTYTEVVPDRSLRWVTHFKSFPTKETRVAALLEEVDGATELTIQMENFESPEERDANKQAWRTGLATLATILK